MDGASYETATPMATSTFVTFTGTTRGGTGTTTGSTTTGTTTIRLLFPKLSSFFRSLLGGSFII